MAHLALSARWFLGIVIVTSGLDKLSELENLHLILERYRILPSRYLRPASRVLIALEMCLGTWLVSGLYATWSSIAASVFFLGLAGIVSYRLLLSSIGGISCGCGGVVGDSTLSWRTVARSLALTAIGLLGMHQSAWPQGWHFTILATCGLSFALYTVTELRHVMRTLHVLEHADWR